MRSTSSNQLVIYIQINQKNSSQNKNKSHNICHIEDVCCQIITENWSYEWNNYSVL